MIDMKILISIILLGISSLASASVINACIDAEGKKIATAQPCEKLGLKDANAALLPAVAAASIAAAMPNATSASGAESFLMPALPKVTVERKVPPTPPPNPWMELIHNDYSLLMLMGACPFLFAFFWYIFEYRMRRR
ncbi:hypothetical protein [Undibacterium sp.]|jgi:hypothetical protein|uniref:hypothetical protein n=1 Tax=Undibacterium sp. TaxID=1914977 RepID=UPI002C5FFC78|nr:hypothetical protein [Undibacterium sp.]HTD06218.1 hypothetical protein [Undibacterium sp.]